MDSVRLYGGPAHGKVMAFDGMRIEVMVPPPRMPSFIGAPVDFDDFQIKTASYYVERFAERRHRPERQREIKVGLLEGAKLHPREQYELEREIVRQPWQFPPADFIKDFDEWFAQAVYRHTGELRWKARRIYDY